MGIKSSVDWIKAKAILYHIGRGSMLAAADYCAARAVDYAAVDTGFMASHIQIVAGQNDIVASVISTAYYSQWIEFGHMSTAGNFVPPQPFMRPAMADTARAFGEIARKQSIARPMDSVAGDALTVTLSF